MPPPQAPFEAATKVVSEKNLGQGEISLWFGERAPERTHGMVFQGQKPPH